MNLSIQIFLSLVLSVVVGLMLGEGAAAPVIKEEVFSFQAVIEKEKAAARKEALAEAEEAQKI